MHTLKDLIAIRQSFARDLDELDQPEPGKLWQHGQWVVTMQTIIEFDKIIDEWSHVTSGERKRSV
jgi:hypothetical protein